MGFFKNINANLDFEVLENYIKNKEWKINDSSQDFISEYSEYRNCAKSSFGSFGSFDSFDIIYDFPWSFQLVNGIYVIDSCICYEGAIYREVRALEDTGVLFRAMIDKKPIRIIAGVTHVNNRKIDIKLIFDINNGDRKIIAYETQRKMKKSESIEATYNPNYNFERNYTLQQQKLAKRYSYNSQQRFKR